MYENDTLFQYFVSIFLDYKYFNSFLILYIFITVVVLFAFYSGFNITGGIMWRG